MHYLIDNLIVIQLIGFIALGLSLLVFQLNKRDKMLKLQTSAAVLYTIHFFLLGALTGAAMNMTGALRGYLFYKIKKRTWLLPVFFIIMFSVVGILTWQGPLSLLPIIASVSGTLAFWQRHPKYVRILALIAPPLWFTYNAIVGSYPGMIAEVVTVLSIIVGMYRFDIRKKTFVKIPVRNKQ